MSEYVPDKWILVEVTSKHGTFQKIFASWYGGFGGSDSWKLSSGNTNCIDRGKYWEFPQASGSTYKCGKDNVGTSMYTQSILSGLVDGATENAYSIKVLTEPIVGESK